MGETFIILAGNENYIIRKDEVDMCALDKLRSGKTASTETSDETTCSNQGASFCPFFVCFFGKGLDYLDRNSGKQNTKANRFKR